MKSFDLSKVDKSYADKRLRLLSNPSNKLAEFLGIITGDGYMNYYKKHYNSILEIAGDSRHDKKYLLEYVNDLIEELFNIKPGVVFRKDQNTMYLRISSKGLISYLGLIGFKKGKKEQIGIPKWILENDKFMNSFVKGLADTDFSLVLLNRKQKRYKYYPKISIASKSKTLIKLLNKWLNSQNILNFAGYDYLKEDKRGYNDSIINYLHINGRKRLEKWMKLIAFRNERQLKKYYLYKKSGPREI